MNDIEVIKNNLKMRNAVGIILIRYDGFVWTGKRRNGPGVRLGEKNLWQMPQGGIAVSYTHLTLPTNREV